MSAKNYKEECCNETLWNDWYWAWVSGNCGNNLENFYETKETRRVLLYDDTASQEKLVSEAKQWLSDFASCRSGIFGEGLMTRRLLAASVQTCFREGDEKELHRADYKRWRAPKLGVSQWSKTVVESAKIDEAKKQKTIIWDNIAVFRLEAKYTIVIDFCIVIVVSPLLKSYQIERVF